MVEVTVEELRDLSHRARRAHAWGVGVVAAGMLTLPVYLYLASVLPAFLAGWSAFALMLGLGALLLRFAHIAGEERGAYRKLFREVRQRQKEARRAEELAA